MCFVQVDLIAPTPKNLVINKMGFVVINASADVIVCKLQLLSVDNAKRLSVSNFTFYLFDFTIKDYLSKTWRNSRIIFAC